MGTIQGDTQTSGVPSPPGGGREDPPVTLKASQQAQKILPTSGPPLAPPPRITWEAMKRVADKELQIESPIARIGRLFHNFLSRCARKIANLSVTIFSAYLSLLYPPFRRTDTLLRMVHARFHRKAIDGAKHKDSFPILDGGTPWMSFDHFMKNDWEPARALLKNWAALSERSQQTLRRVEETLSKSKIFFRTAFDRFVPQKIKAYIALQKIHHLKPEDILVIPAGMTGHSVLYEVQKTSTGIHLKIYDAGAATDPRTGKFSVPVFEIESKDVKRVLEEMFALDSLSEKGIFKKYSLARTEPSLIIAAIKKTVGSEPILAETHRAQDRGNCFWKAFSTWMNSQLKECSVVVSPEIAASSREKTPYATEDLNCLAATKEAIPLTRFMHRIAYEKVRKELQELFATSKPGIPFDLKKDKLMFFSFTAYYTIDSEATDKRAADEYISSLVRGIIEAPAAWRYLKKDLRRWYAKLSSSPTEQ